MANVYEVYQYSEGLWITSSDGLARLNDDAVAEFAPPGRRSIQVIRVDESSGRNFLRYMPSATSQSYFAEFTNDPGALLWEYELAHVGVGSERQGFAVDSGRILVGLPGRASVYSIGSDTALCQSSIRGAFAGAGRSDRPCRRDSDVPS